MVDSPCISSFVIRIVKEEDPRLSAFPYRGVIRHVQSDQELSFMKWSDAEKFIQRFVPIHQMGPVKDGSNDGMDATKIQDTIQSE